MKKTLNANQKYENAFDMGSLFNYSLILFIFNCFCLFHDRNNNNGNNIAGIANNIIIFTVYI